MGEVPLYLLLVERRWLSCRKTPISYLSISLDLLLSAVMSWKTDVSSAISACGVCQARSASKGCMETSRINKRNSTKRNVFDPCVFFK
jgi:hypothetical protein